MTPWTDRLNSCHRHQFAYTYVDSLDINH